MRSVKEPRVSLPQKGNVPYVIGQHGTQPEAHTLKVPSHSVSKKLKLAGEQPVPPEIGSGADVATGLNS